MKPDQEMREIAAQPESALSANGRKAWSTPRVIVSELGGTDKINNSSESPATAFGGGGVLTNQGPS